MTRIGKLGRHANGSLTVRVNGKSKYMPDSKNKTMEEGEAWVQSLREEAKVSDRTAAENEISATLEDMLGYYQRMAISGQITPNQIEHYLATKVNWNDTTKVNCCKHLSAIFNWLIKERRLTYNPVKFAKKPMALTRGGGVRY